MQNNIENSIRNYSGSNDRRLDRRDALAKMAAVSTALAAPQAFAADSSKASFPTYDKAQIAITLDLEMARNFPNWEDTHWDYEKGNLNQAAKDYTVSACKRVK